MGEEAGLESAADLVGHTKGKYGFLESWSTLKNIIVHCCTLSPRGATQRMNKDSGYL